MQEKSHRDKWWTAMIKKHGSVDAVSAFMSKSNQKGKKSGLGYFYRLKQQGRDSELKQLSQKGLNARHAKKEISEDTD